MTFRRVTYRVIKTFADLQDGRRLYEAGELYPRPGLEVTMERLHELAGSDNAAHMALIEAVEGVSDGPDGEGEEVVEQTERKPQTARRRRVNTDD